MAVNPNLLIVQSDNNCIEHQTGRNFVPCEDRSLLNQRIRVNTNFWQWVSDTNGQLVGRYVDTNNQSDISIVSITEGRLLHDHISDATVCNGQAFTIWNDVWVSSHTQGMLQINNSTNTTTRLHSS